MKYIVTKSFNKDGIWGRFDIDVGETLNSMNGIICYNDHQVCFERSQNAHDHFTFDEDGNGLERRMLIDEIFSILSEMHKKYDDAVKEILNDETLTPEEREEAISKLVDEAALAFERIHADAELDALLTNGVWNHSFYVAQISTLQKLKYVICEV